MCALIPMINSISAQNVYTIKADSVKLTNCDSTELILENHTQGVKGFLYNTGNGRTIFKKGVVKVNDSLYLIGADSLKYNAWVQGGNRWGTTGVLGTFDNNHLGIYTNSLERMRLTNTGRLLVGTTTDNGVNTMQVNGSIYNNYFTNISPSTTTTSGAIRLRWGSGDGSYISFYYQGNFNRRAFIGSPADVRPLYLMDSVGITFGTTPKIAIGTENAFNNAKLSVLKPYQQSIDVFNAGRILTDTTKSIDLQVIANGNVLVGGGADRGYVFQATTDKGVVGLIPNLSRALDQIRIGGAINTGDGQNSLISVSDNGAAFKNVLVERDGNIGLGSAGAGPWYVGNPSFRINTSGYPCVFAQYYYFGNYNGPVNSSALVTSVSNINEWSQGVGNYPNGQNYYSIGTVLNGAEIGNKRAPLKFGADQLVFMTGVTDVEVGRFSESGNLGLGTNAPSAQLHTTGTVRFAGLTNDDTQTRVIVSDATGKLYYRTAASLAANDILRSSLAVNGPIRARSLTLESSGRDWPDYVFDSSYMLSPLDEVESYVKKQGHLPGLASAGEIGRSGIDVGLTQAALLKKIEELTLYAIGQEKDIKALKDLNARQSKALETLSAQMEELKKIVLDKK